MPCDSVRSPQQTAAQRQAQIDAALSRLEAALRERAVRIQVGPQGAIAFIGWDKSERSGLSDVCAYRTLSQKGSWELRQAVHRAEAAAGRRINEQAIAAGVHAHDGKWYPGH